MARRQSVGFVQISTTTSSKFQLFKIGNTNSNERIFLYFLSRRQIVGSSILIIYDDVKVGAWMIDFAKTRPVPPNVLLTHRLPWSPGNHEDGFLFGLDHLVNVSLSTFSFSFLVSARNILFGRCAIATRPPSPPPTRTFLLKSTRLGLLDENFLIPRPIHSSLPYYWYYFVLSSTDATSVFESTLKIMLYAKTTTERPINIEIVDSHSANKSNMFFSQRPVVRKKGKDPNPSFFSSHLQILENLRLSHAVVAESTTPSILLKS